MNWNGLKYQSGLNRLKWTGIDWMRQKINRISINSFVSCLVNWFGPQHFKDGHVVSSIIWLMETKAPLFLKLNWINHILKRLIKIKRNLNLRDRNWKISGKLLPFINFKNQVQTF